ncbi:MAG TPA: recombinase family protein [Chloroflexota bacterium]|nr:recombinase family protein [Chloroflexota bacterium]
MHHRAVRPVRRAVGIVRVSKVGDRAGDSFISPLDQRHSITVACDREGIALVSVFEELDVSGGDPLTRRAGLSNALALIEQGNAEVLVVAYFDRLFRHLGVQREVLERVEQAGGTVLAVDAGEIRTDTASRWLSSTMLGMVAEYHRRITREKTNAARADAVRRGVPPFPNIVPGYRRGDDGHLVVHDAEAAHVVEAFLQRAAGASIFEVRDFLRTRGITRSYRATQTLLRSRMVLGEIRSGSLVNPNAHAPIVDRSLWQRVQSVRIPRGPHGDSERLLARLGVLRCGSCGALMGATYGYHQRGGKHYPKYRCGMAPECTAPAMISASLVEDAVVARVKQLLEDQSESASADMDVAEAEAEVELRQSRLDAAIDAFEGIDAAKARARLLDLQGALQQAEARLDRLRATATRTSVSLNAASDWDDLSIQGRRDLIRASIERVDVRPGRGLERISIQAFLE